VKRATPEGKLDKNGNPLKFQEILNQTGQPKIKTIIMD